MTVSLAQGPTWAARLGVPACGSGRDRAFTRPPDRTRRADFPHRAPTLGNSGREPFGRPRVKDRGHRKGEALGEAMELFRVPPAALAPPHERPMPDALHREVKALQRVGVRWDGVVVVVPGDDPSQPGMLSHYALVSPLPALHLDARKLRPHLLP